MHCVASILSLELVTLLFWLFCQSTLTAAYRFIFGIGLMPVIYTWKSINGVQTYSVHLGVLIDFCICL